MTSTRTTFAAALLLLLSLVVFAACSSKPDRYAGQTVLDRVVSADPESLDPQRGRSTQSNQVLRDIGEGLMGFAPDGALVTAAAASVATSDDGLTYTFTLRPESRWSNGEPVVAEDFASAMRRLVDPATAAFYAGHIAMVKNAAAITAGEQPVAALGVSAPDEQTLVIELEQPTPYFLSLLTHPSTFPVNRTALAANGDGFTAPGRLPSNGAFVLSEWSTGSLIVLERNPEYRDAANVDIDVVRYHVISQEMIELQRFRAGELDITTTVPAENFEAVKKEFPDELRIAPTLGVYFYGLNLTKPPFKENPALRQALSMAIDREELVEKITARGEAPAYSWVPPGLPDYTPPKFSYASLTQAERNSLARSLYSQAGYGEDKPLTIEIRYNTSDTHRRIALAIQGMWKDVLGVETKLVSEEFQVLLANMRAREVTQVFRSSWIGDFPDAITFLGILEPGATWNLPGYENDEYKTMLDNAASQRDAGRRRLYLEEAERVMLEDHPVLPLYFYVSKHLVSTRIEGWGDNLMDYHYSQHLRFKTAGE